ncbi:MAG: D-glycero-alpha-D-manno-heptose-1,7-bisphosphate 7-phosphatase [Hyphomonadaceae bacterium]
MGKDGSERTALKAAVFFDRDGTLNRDEGYTFKPEDLHWNAGAIEAVRAVNGAGRLAIVVTNQSGIGRGLFDEAAMHRFHARMESDLAAHGARIDAWYFAPHHPDAAIEALRHPDHPDRKPNPGMILRALREHGIDPGRSLLVGDSPADLAAARAAGVMGVAYRGENLAELVRKAMAAAP